MNFSDEVTAAFRLADACVLVVDAIEGVMMNTERLIIHALQEKLPIVLVINKIDRLILELKLPPNDAYHKLRHTLDEINTLIGLNSEGVADAPVMSPALGNVCFASAAFGFSFTVQSFAKLYVEQYGWACIAFKSARHFPAGAHDDIDPTELAKRLWGDVFYSPDRRTFSKKQGQNMQRSFVHFVLDPIYKIFSQVRCHP